MEQNKAYDLRDEQERFARVWKRVMPTVRADCPITLWTKPDDSTLPSPDDTPPEVSGPVTWQPTVNGMRQDDFPDRANVPCLGGMAASYAEILQDMIQTELKDWHFYQAMARRAGTQARVFSALAADAWRHAKRLSAAHFLSSGLRYWPEPSGNVSISSYLGALRQRFIAEQNGAAAYLAAAAGCEDPCLRQLFLEHAEDDCDHACLIRNVVEQI